MTSVAPKGQHLISAPVTQKGQVTIPVDLRRRLGINTPDHVDVFLGDDGDIHIRAKRSIVRELAGSVKPLPGREHVNYEEVRHLMLEDVANDIVRDTDGR